jgi:adenylate cyclase
VSSLKKLVEGILIGAAAALAALIVWNAGILERLEYATWTWREQFFAKPGPATGGIKLILLDQQSLDWGKNQNGLSWPWPREVYVPIIDFCARHGAKAVIFDVLYSEPSVYGVTDDRALGEAIGRAPLFVGSMCLHRGANFSTSWPEYILDRSSFDVENLYQSGGGLSMDEITRLSATFPVEEVASSATALANVTEDPDVDGVFRRANLFRIFDGRFVPSMGFAAFAMQCANRGGSSGAKSATPALFEKGRLKICGKTIPIDRQGRIILRFRGPAGVFQTYSAAAVIESDMLAGAGREETIESAESFKDAFVLLGFSAPGLADLRPTPLSNICPGVEIHATLLDNLITGDYLRDTSAAATALSTFLLAILAAVSVVSLATRAWHSVPAIALFAPMPAAIGFAAYPLGFWWPVVVQTAAVGTALAGAIILNYATEGRRKAFIKKAFRHYLSPAVIESILKDPSQLKLGGERKELTILFSDVEGFSTFSEKLDPEHLTSLLNLFLSDMTDIILDEGGTLDKYEGDAIIAFWNAPVDQDDHADRACRAALRCRQKILEQQEEYSRKAGGTPLRMRIGINTGIVVVGNMGSAKRFDYTVLGDAANLASRLEGANKFFGTRIMISEQTWQKTSGTFAGRKLGRIRVVGRATPVPVFELTGMEAAPEEPDKTFDQAVACCLAKKWSEALDLFDRLPGDPVAGLYAQYCRNLTEDPGKDWDCVWNLDRK